jgi:Tfp pilus assembly protein PilN
MVNINLLPWRPLERAYQAKQLKKIICLAFISPLLAALCAVWLFSLYEQRLASRVHLLKDEIHWQENANNTSKQTNLAISPDMLASLISYAENTNALLSVLHHTSSETVCFREIKRTNQAILITGEADSSDDLAFFLKQWKAVDLFSEIKVDHLKQKSDHVVQFRLSATTNQRFPNIFPHANKAD